MEKIRFKPDVTLAQQCYDQLKHEIIDGDLKPGQKIKTATIKERFNIGQSPIREALSRLVSCGLVEVEDNKGFRVAPLTVESVRDICTSFVLIENVALALAIERGDDAWEAAIVGALHQLEIVESKEKSEVPYELWEQRNNNFHLTLIGGCKSPILIDIRNNIYMKYDRFSRFAYAVQKKPLVENHAEHKKLAQAVIKRDVKAAHEIMSNHILYGLEDFIENLKKEKVALKGYYIKRGMIEAYCLYRRRTFTPESPSPFFMLFSKTIK